MPAQGRLIKTTEARSYESTFKLYELRHFKQIEAIRSAFKAKTLSVDYFFVFHKARVLTKQNTLKKIDVANRVKIIQDCLSKIIDIDDCFFVTGKLEKLWCEDAKDEQVIVKISEASLRQYEGVQGL